MTNGSALSQKNSGVKAFLARYPFAPAFIILTILFALNGYYEPRSLSFWAIKGLFSTYLALMLLAVAQTYVVFSGDIDLSNGVILSLVNVVTVVLMDKLGGGAGSILLACLIGVLTGALCGLVNGILVAGLRLQAIVTTFATSIFFGGLALTVLPVSGLPAPELFWTTYGGSVFGIPFVYLAIVFIAVVLAVFIRTRLVTQMLAVGDDALAAYQSGLPVVVVRIKGYVLCGVFAALAALCITGDTASGDPIVGAKMTLNGIAAVVLGGTALSGGFGTVSGSMAGALIIGLISSLVAFVGIPSDWQNLVQGLAILAALMAGILISRSTRA